MLPLLPLPSIATGVPILVTLALSLVRPRWGLVAYAFVLAYAIATDWTRLQPAPVSFVFLIAVGLPGTAGRAIARAHLLSLWFYAGAHKILSTEFLAQSDPWILRGLTADPPAWMQANFTATVVVLEIGLALMAAVRATRHIAAVAALALHGGILLAISPVGHNWNPSVWAWNVVLALSGFLLIAPWREDVLTTFRSQSVLVRALLLCIAVYPAASQLGVGDPYLAHHLYSRSAPIGYVCRTTEPPGERPGLGDVYETADGRYRCRFVDYYPWVGVPEPGEHAFFRRDFERTCAAGETLLIRERRWFFVARGAEWTFLPCPRERSQGGVATRYSAGSFGLRSVLPILRLR